MMTKNADKKREQMMMFSMDDMVPQNHISIKAGVGFVSIHSQPFCDGTADLLFVY